MTETTEATTGALRVEVTLLIEGDWQSDPLRVVAGIQKGEGNLEAWQRKAVAAARDQGATWEDIGKACGVSRQAAWERFSTD